MYFLLSAYFIVQVQITYALASVNTLSFEEKTMVVYSFHSGAGEL